MGAKQLGPPLLLRPAALSQLAPCLSQRCPQEPCVSAPCQPRAQVLAPYDSEDARGLLKAAIRDPDPVVFLENEMLYGQAFPVTPQVCAPARATTTGLEPAARRPADPARACGGSCP